MSGTVHIPVLLQQTISALSPKAGDVILDATLGGGGHTEALLKKGVHVIALDADPASYERVAERIPNLLSKLTYVEGNFRHAEQLLRERGINRIEGALFDLGLSSDELEQSGRGFTFRKDEPLLMTFSPSQDFTASDLIAHVSERELADIIRTYGEDRYANRIARAIVEAQKERPITRTGELAELIERTVPKAFGSRRIHPATKTFQALRMAVNDELDALREGIAGAWNVLSVGGRCAVISFHSAEDRIVKQWMRALVDEGKGELLAKKPQEADEEELTTNPRSRSAKLRSILKTV